MEVGDENLHHHMSLLRAWYKLLRKKYGSAGFESELPLEFVVTNHAKQRLTKRLSYPHKDIALDLMLDAWHDGEDTPDTFKKNKGHKPKNCFSKFVYKYYEGYIWIWGIKPHRNIPGGQKYLVTIYNWRK